MADGSHIRQKTWTKFGQAQLDQLEKSKTSLDEKNSEKWSRRRRNNNIASVQ